MDKYDSKKRRLFSQSAGLLFIGDPHLSSTRPGRRMDIDFKQTVIDKLAQSFGIAREHRYQPVILGDLFDSAGEKNLSLFSRFLSVLSAHKESGGLIPVTLLGNHDLKDSSLSEDTALAVVASSGLLRVLDDGEPFYIVPDRPIQEVPDEAGMSSLDEESFLSLVNFVLLPYSYGGEYHEGGLLDPFFSLPIEKKYDMRVVALTHGDFDFPGSYPGATPTREIAGVDMVVNGHMHKLQPAMRHGKTIWFNPGNITRMSMDCENHMPRVWALEKNDEILTGIPLKYQEKVFNRTGNIVDKNDRALKDEMYNGETIHSDYEYGTSRFVEMLKNQKSQDAPLTEDASELLVELKSVCEEQKTDTVTLGIIHQMMNEIL